MTGITGFGNLTQTSTMMTHTMQREQSNRFEDLLKSAKAAVSNNSENEKSDIPSQISSNQVIKNSTRLNGDIASDF